MPPRSSSLFGFVDALSVTSQRERPAIRDLRVPEELETLVHRGAEVAAHGRAGLVVLSADAGGRRDDRADQRVLRPLVVEREVEAEAVVRELRLEAAPRTRSYCSGLSAVLPSRL